MSKPSEEDLILYYYGEAEDPEGIARALESSSELRAELEQLTALLDAIDEPPVPELTPAYGATTWAKIRPRIEEPKGLSSWLRPSPRWVWAGALGAALIVAFLAGQRFPVEAPTRLADADRERILLTSVADHLDRSQMLLLEIVNEKGGAIDLETEGPRAAELVDHNRLYRQTASTGKRGMVVDVLEELERFLVEISHSEPDTDLEALRERLHERDLLFRVRILGSSLREAARSTPSKPPQATSI